jgi:S1/P1 Nuclease
MPNPSYLMTWNPTRFNWTDYPEDVLTSKSGEIVETNWSTGNNQSIVPGDRVYLLRQAIDRGIVGAGITTSRVRPRHHWNDPKKTSLAVRINWDVLLWPQQGLPTSKLQEAMPDHTWDRIQASGTSVPPQYIETLAQMWGEHLASLGQNQPFQVGQNYSRKDVYRILQVPKGQQGGDWDTGSHQHDGHWYIFAAIGATGRTGHDYANHWDGNELVWFGRTGSKLAHPKTQSLLHLVGDIHQPLHNCSLLSETFPAGDRGGNESLVRIEGGRPIQLHKMFDDLLGQERSPSAIGAAAAAEVDQAERDGQQAIGSELKEHTTPAAWSKEGFDLAVKFAYLDGDLRPANAQAKLSDADVPSVAEVYAQNAGRMARVQIAKAGRRLATALAQGLGAKTDTGAQ